MERFQFDPDEGLEVMRSMLVVHGHSLYSEIWSNQTPLFTYALAFLFTIFGFDANVGRIFVLILSSLLLWASCQLLRNAWGIGHALTGALLIVILPQYIRLSVSSMIGLPALALAMLSLLFLTIWHRRHKNLWLVMSAVAFGLSIYTKVITGFLFPVFVVGIVVVEYAQTKGDVNWKRLLKPAFLWTSVFAIVTIVLGLALIGPGNVAQLFGTHLTAEKIEYYLNFSKEYNIKAYLRDSQITILALMGILFSLQSRQWISIYII
jgi:4-amino-4-deoxy-L-arabinose transferase-like glycosyltransferase